MEQTYNFKKIIQIIWHNLFFILLCAIVLGGVMGVFAKMKQSTEYTAVRNVVIEQRDDVQDGNEVNDFVQDNINKMNTYSEIATDGVVLNKVRKELAKKEDIKLGLDELSEKVDVKAKANSYVLSFKVKDHSKRDAEKISDTITAVFRSNLNKYIDDNVSVSLLSAAKDNATYSVTGPSIKKYTFLGLAVGGFLGIIAAFSIDTYKYLK